MISDRHDNFFSRVLRNLALPILFLVLATTSGALVSAESGAYVTSGSNIAESVLIAVIIGLVLSILVIAGIVVWGRKQDSVSNTGQDREQSIG